METNNETVEQVCEEMEEQREDVRDIAYNEKRTKSNLRYELLIYGERYVTDYARRVREAHKREIADEQKRFANILGEQIAEVERAAKVIAEKDAEIKRLKQEVTGLQLQMGDDDLLKMANDIDRKDAEIASLRSLVKELACGFVTIKNAARFKEYGGKGVRFGGSVTTNFWHMTADIAKKAREVMNG